MMIGDMQSLPDWTGQGGASQGGGVGLGQGAMQDGMQTPFGGGQGYGMRTPRRMRMQQPMQAPTAGDAGVALGQGVMQDTAPQQPTMANPMLPPQSAQGGQMMSWNPQSQGGMQAQAGMGQQFNPQLMRMFQQFMMQRQAPSMRGGMYGGGGWMY